jgi:predicted nucleic acid-binding Zn ribbon protein
MVEPPREPSMPTVPCPSCGAEVAVGDSFCPACGADVQMAAVRGRRRRGEVPWMVLAALLVVVAAIAALWARFKVTGPGPDLSTTAEWLVLGDRGRVEELATLSRAYETARALDRTCLDRGVPPTLDGIDWTAVAAYSNASYRGFVSLIQWAAGPDAIRGRLAWLLDVDGRDGWGRPWRAQLAAWTVTHRPHEFFPGVLDAGSPPPADRPLLHLSLVSAGPDGRFDTRDDIVFEALFPAPTPLRIRSEQAVAEHDAEIERGLVWTRIRGARYDLVDARVLGEFYLEREGER